MKHRRFLKLIGLPAVAAAGAGYVRAARSRNRYYDGPVSDHFDGVRFFSPGQPQDKGLLELMRWQLGGGRKEWPEVFASPFRDRPPAAYDGLRVALVGHATVLIQVAGLNILTDPVFSERASPVSFAGPRRVNPPGIAFEALPKIHAVLITHNHSDHASGLPRIRERWPAVDVRNAAPDACRDGDDLRADVTEILDSTEVYDDTGIRLRWIVGTVVVLGGAAASREDLDAVVAEILDLEGVADVDVTDVDVR